MSNPCYLSGEVLNNLINADRLQQVINGDIDTLTLLDDNGLLLGPDESLTEYANRLQKLHENIVEFNRELDEKQQIELFDMALSYDNAIPPDIFENARQETISLYGFAIDWVPGFFTNTEMGILFAGCAIYSYEDFFAVFVIRKAFKEQQKWIIYDRTELMAHELCHIAHIGFKSKNYEELFAYQTSQSWFRRLLGGMFRTSFDTYLILAAMLVLLVSQSINITVRSPMEWNEFPMPLIFGLTFGSFFYIFFRHIFSIIRFRFARTKIGMVFGSPSSMAVLFRCSDREIKEISQCSGQDTLHDWIHEKVRTSNRWRMILKKFGGDDSPDFSTARMDDE